MFPAPRTFDAFNESCLLFTDDAPGSKATLCGVIWLFLGALFGVVLDVLVLLEFGETGLVVNELDPLEKLLCCCSFGVGGTFRGFIA